jgi:hypothetical protein
MSFSIRCSGYGKDLDNLTLIVNVTLDFGYVKCQGGDWKRFLEKAMFFQ